MKCARCDGHSRGSRRNRETDPPGAPGRSEAGRSSRRFRASRSRSSSPSFSRCSISKSRKSAARATRGPTFGSGAATACVAVVQCKYHKQGLVGSPELQKFLGTIHHTRSQKGFFVTTSTFTLVRREVRRGKPHRASGRPAARRARQPRDGPETETRDRASIILMPVTDNCDSKCSY